MFPNQGYSLPPLDEFVVAEQKRERMGLARYLDEFQVRWEMLYAHKVVKILSRKPAMLDVYLPDNDVQAGWRIEWQG